MLALPLYTILIGVTIWGFFSSTLAWWVFLSFFVLFAAWLIATSWSLRPSSLGVEEPPYFFTDAEMSAFKKHAFYFIYPFQAKQYSSVFSMLQGLSIVWLGLHLWRKEWFLCGFAVGTWFAAANMAAYMNPSNLLRFHKARGNLPDFQEDRLAALEGVEDKLTEWRNRKWENKKQVDA